ncbi:MAG: N-acylglucosamine 2-epimerase [Lachnospiraceae bacterium]|nr:N-acylglucosamine 2-epimerase [Lachnospiraceae bacterium]
MQETVNEILEKEKEKKAIKEEAKNHLTGCLLPFWKGLKDDTYGGFYGYLSYDLELDKKAVKGCILNSRILWFFSKASKTLKDNSLLSYAAHAFDFLKNKCLDHENGGMYWSLNYDGTVCDATKHTYNQAFAIYALSAYYEVMRDKEALFLALSLIDLIEERMKDEYGYLEAFDASFHSVSNEKLSENGVMAEKTMNTLLHVLEAYTEAYRVTKHPKIAEKLRHILTQIADKVYNKELHRQEVFFDRKMNTLIDLHSFGHDIEAAWLIDRTLSILKDASYTAKLSEITKDLTAEIYKSAYKEHSLLNECDRGILNKKRIWWVQAEAVTGFLNGYEHDNNHPEYLKASIDIFHYIMEKMVDKRPGSEWFSELDENGLPSIKNPIVEPWKCPYHNGRMCFELLRRDW